MRTIYNFNTGWYFFRDEQGYEFNDLNFSEAFWLPVTTPHTAHIEPLPVKKMWQGICWYYKKFTLKKTDERVFLKFGGAMLKSDFWVNGNHVKTNEFGYLPVLLDLTDELNDGENIVTVRLNNEDNPDIPPGKPLDKLDFLWYGGLYREVKLIVTDKLHVTDAMTANVVAGGGIFVTFPKVTALEAVVHVKTHVMNEGRKTNATLLSELVDKDGQTVASSTTDFTLNEASSVQLETDLIVSNPLLWHPFHPYLYTLRTRVLRDKKTADYIETKVGIRSIEITKEKGFVINGEPLYLRGCNYHQEYPYIGYALSRQAHFRNAKMIKEAGFDYIRLAHYPHSEDFMEACDELGLVVMDCITGWQYIGGEHFRETSFNEARALIRRDRNHPCVVLWELSLNETFMDEAFMIKMHEIGHAEYPGNGFYSCGYLDCAYDVFIGNTGHGDWGHGCAPYYYVHPEQSKNHKTNRGRACIASEYGSWEFGALESTSIQDRGSGEEKLLIQSKNHQITHNSNRKLKLIGDGLWVMCDYNRGCSVNTKINGAMDLFRLPKFSYYFFKSQRSPEFGPLVHIASYYTPKSSLSIRIYSNCEEAALYQNGRLIERAKPVLDENSSDLAYPPFIINLQEYERGLLSAIGYINGKEVARHTIRTPEEPAQLSLDIAVNGYPSTYECTDSIFVYATVKDANGTVVTDFNSDITFSANGCRIIGPETVQAKAGIAPLLIQVGPEFRGEAIQITAHSHNLKGSVILNQ